MTIPTYIQSTSSLAAAIMVSAALFGCQKSDIQSDNKRGNSAGSGSSTKSTIPSDSMNSSMPDEPSDDAANTSTSEPGNDQESKDNEPGKLQNSESQRFTKIASDHLTSMNVPVAERVADISVNGSSIKVVYPPPAGSRAGDFIVIIDRNTGEVLDTKIWR